MPVSQPTVLFMDLKIWQWHPSNLGTCGDPEVFIVWSSMLDQVCRVLGPVLLHGGQKEASWGPRLDPGVEGLGRV